MLVLPIINRDRGLNVQIRLKGAEKVRQHINYSGIQESDILVNGKLFSNSLYFNSKDDSATADFIRYNLLHSPKRFIITTSSEKDSPFYDVYDIAPPPRKVASSLENLYSKVITDMRKEVPGTNNGRYLSLEKIGFTELFTDEKIAILKNIVTHERDTSKWPALFKEAGVADMVDSISFLKYFDCEVIPKSAMSERSLVDSLKSLEVVHTRDYKNLRSFYDKARSNRDIYSKLSYVSQLVYNEPLNLIQSKSQKEKHFVKAKEGLNAA